MRRPALAVIVFAITAGLLHTTTGWKVLAAQASRPKANKAQSVQEYRASVIARAQIWTETDVRTVDLKTGPKGEKAFPFDDTVTCTYVNKKLSGNTPKFACRIEPDDELKVKYGGNNGEVYAEVAATRLLWALGFGADRQYTVRVLCRG